MEPSNESAKQAEQTQDSLLQRPVFTTCQNCLIAVSQYSIGREDLITLLAGSQLINPWGTLRITILEVEALRVYML